MTETKKETMENRSGSKSAGVPCYVATLLRGIPIDGPMTDVCTHICKPGETVDEVMQWVEQQTKGNAWTIKLEITQAT